MYVFLDSQFLTDLFWRKHGPETYADFILNLLQNYTYSSVACKVCQLSIEFFKKCSADEDL